MNPFSMFNNQVSRSDHAAQAPINAVNFACGANPTSEVAAAPHPPRHFLIVDVHFSRQEIPFLQPDHSRPPKELQDPVPAAAQ